jgi:ribonuclease D
MSVLEVARRAYARIQARRNGHLKSPLRPCQTCDIRALSAPTAAPAAPAYLLVKTPAGLDAVAAAVDGSTVIGLDTETTGLSWRADRLRLLSLSCDTVDGGRFTYLVDCFAADPAPLWEALTDKALVIHNAAFDLAFLSRAGFTPTAPVHDTLLLARVLEAGGTDFHHCSLAECCRRYLDRVLDKEEQRSDWSGELTAGQLTYASRDAEVLAPLYHALAQRLGDAGLERAAEIETRALPAFC